MAYTEAQKIALEKAIASGTLRVRYEGREVEYRSLAEMEKILATINNTLTAPKRQYLATTLGDKGL